MTIQERINYYKERREIENKIIEDRKAEIIYRLSNARSNNSFKSYLNEATAEINERFGRIESFDLLIKEFENQASEERSE